MAIAAFSLSLLGTFLVRSGVLTSVHAFASDPKRGIFILIFSGCGDRWLAHALRVARKAGPVSDPNSSCSRGVSVADKQTCYSQWRHRQFCSALCIHCSWTL
jgi:hypothetical protein